MHTCFIVWLRCDAIKLFGILYNCMIILLLLLYSMNLVNDEQVNGVDKIRNQ